MTLSSAQMPQHGHSHKFGAASTSGGSAPHDNMDPFLAVTFSIALDGIYPSFKRAESEGTKQSLRDIDAFVGQIIMTAFNFPPIGFSLCDGSLISIASYPALFR